MYEVTQLDVVPVARRAGVTTRATVPGEDLQMSFSDLAW